MKAIRISFSIILGILAACCLYAVVFQHRPEHLFIAALYIMFIVITNLKEKSDQ